MPLRDLLGLLAEGKTLSIEQTREAISTIMSGSCDDAQIASFLTALRVRGETTDELFGAAQVMREKMRPIAKKIPGLLDTCGTGGDATGTFNISTATAIVACACGVPVAKHGNRSVSSSSGSADVLAELGVDIDVDPQATCESLNRIGLGFFFAPRWHPAMKHVMPVRRQLRFRTIFNLLGPLCNPAAAEYQLLGVGQWEWAEPMAEILKGLGSRSATVVWGADGLDEVTLGAQTRAVCLRDEKLSIQNWTAQTFGLPSSEISQWQVSSPQESASVITKVLAGEPGPRRDIVLANVAVALWTVGKVADLLEGVVMATEAIDSGKAREKLDRLRNGKENEKTK